MNANRVRLAVLLIGLLSALLLLACGEKKGEEKGAEAEKADESAAAAEEKTAAEKAEAEKKAELEKKVAEVKKIFADSLHATGAGMKHWYDKGFKQVVGMEYEKLDCKNCHVKSCEACHEEGDYGADVCKDNCLKCHSRYKATVAMDKAAGIEDPHAEMDCTKCHPISDMHGDGKKWASMRERDFLKADCLDCHKRGEDGASKYDPSIDSHSAHGDKLTCQACHVSNTIACLNCHFDEFLETGSRAGNFVKGKDWLLLVNYQDKVTAGTMMSLVTEGKAYATFAPYTSHSITAEGRQCGDCHGTETMQTIAKGKSVPITEFENGGLAMAEGVIPLAEGKIDIAFMDKNDEGEWIEMKPKGEPTITVSEYGEYLTEDQIEKLAEKMD